MAFEDRSQAGVFAVSRVLGGFPRPLGLRDLSTSECLAASAVAWGQRCEATRSRRVQVINVSDRLVRTARGPFLGPGDPKARIKTESRQGGEKINAFEILMGFGVAAGG